MKVCLIAEGSYPYVVGGVSSWVHGIIKAFPEIEFSLATIMADRRSRGKFLYELPENLVSVTEVYLLDEEWAGKKRRRGRLRLREKERLALRSLVQGKNVDWETVFRLFSQDGLSLNDLLMGPDFFDIVREFCAERYAAVTFTDFLWTMRSIYLPLFVSMTCRPPAADIYHCVATGYAGVVGSMAKVLHPGSTLLISEHGIYTREREEEIIKAKWVQGIYKDIWIEQFRKMSFYAYRYADRVTALFQQAHELQLELDCPAEKAVITPNGIDVSAFRDLPGKAADDPCINVGAFLRVSPVKDVKTLINAFYYAHQKDPRLKLWIMGPDDEDTAYAEECRNLVSSLQAENIVFTGRIKTTDYIGRMDMTILTSISEGQPLTILESFAAGKPCVATNVGNCAGLLQGESDAFGPAGIIAPVLNIAKIAEAILTLAADEGLRRRMGENGRRRLMARYRGEYMIDAYRNLYRELAEKAGVSYPAGGAERRPARRLEPVIR